MSEDKTEPHSCTFSIPVLISIAQIVLGSLSIVECEYGAIFSIVSGSLMLGTIITYLIGYICGMIISCGEDKIGVSCSKLFIIMTVLTYFIMDILALFETQDAPDTCPHGFKVSMSVLAGVKIAIVTLLLICFCCGFIALSML